MCPKSQCISTVAVRTDLFRRDVDKVLITDFFGSVRNVELVQPYLKLGKEEMIIMPDSRSHKK